MRAHRTHGVWAGHLNEKRTTGWRRPTPAVEIARDDDLEARWGEELSQLQIGLKFFLEARALVRAADPMATFYPPLEESTVAARARAMSLSEYRRHVEGVGQLLGADGLPWKPST